MEKFKKYLLENTNLDKKTVDNYVSSIKKIIKIIGTGNENNINNINKKYYSSEELQIMNSKFHGRLSAALNYYDAYLNNRKISKNKKELWNDYEMEMTLALYLKYGRLNSSNKILRKFTDNLNYTSGNNKPYKSIELRLGNYEAVDPSNSKKGLRQNLENLENTKYYKTWMKNENNFKQLVINLEKLMNEELYYTYDENRMFEEINNGHIKPYSKEELKRKNFNKDISKNENKYYSIKARDTDERLRATCIFNANYLCEVDPNHRTFIRADNNGQFMECHHIIPIMLQSSDEFKNINLDCLNNLISICPICHAQIHYGNKEEKKKIITIICKEKKDNLQEILKCDNLVDKILSFYIS